MWQCFPCLTREIYELVVSGMYVGQNALGRKGFLWVIGTLCEMRYPSLLKCKSVLENAVGHLITLSKLEQDILYCKCSQNKSPFRS